MLYNSITPELLQRFDIPGPRYTSYPTANRFVDSFAEINYLQALSERREGAAAGLPLSLYIHIPFCDSLCYYCGCNKIITKHHERALPYLNSLYKEIALVVNTLQTRQHVSQLHFGGGSPTFLSDMQLAKLVAFLKEHFDFLPKAECSIEVDPRTVTRERLQNLWDMGINRLSFGVQDFNADVQQAVHRIQSTESVFALMQDARDIGYTEINVDLIYGLPKQTLATFKKTLNQVVELAPDRLAVYGYAHLPHLFKPQRRILEDDLPSAAERLLLLTTAIQELQKAGYDYIGMDHFALPNDSLSIAKRNGLMHRNFQGYSTHADCDLIALGVSSISKVGAVYSQNAKTIEEYTEQVDRGHLPVMRGVTLTRDDLIRRTVITAIMCQGEIVFEAIELGYMIQFKEYFAHELDQLCQYVKEGFVEINDDNIVVTPLGWYFIRALAMVFDKYLQKPDSATRFSKII